MRSWAVAHFALGRDRETLSVCCCGTKRFDITSKQQGELLEVDLTDDYVDRGVYLAARRAGRYGPSNRASPDCPV